MSPFEDDFVADLLALLDGILSVLGTLDLNFVLLSLRLRKELNEDCLRLSVFPFQKKWQKRCTLKARAVILAL